MSRASGVSAGVGRCVSVYLGPLVSQLHSFLVATARALSPLSFPSVMMTEANAERLAAALCEMRGAALKIGQMLSLADDKHLPPVVRRALGRVCPAFPGTYSSSASTVCLPSRRLHRQQVARALERVRAQADVMPQRQLYGVLREQLGDDWRSKFASFEEKPFAAASIGQVRFWDITHCSLPWSTSWPMPPCGPPLARSYMLSTSYPQPQPRSTLVISTPHPSQRAHGGNPAIVWCLALQMRESES